MSTRREVRERVMQALYAFEQGGGPAEEVLKNVLKPQVEDPQGLKFAESLFLRTLDRMEEVDELIGQHTANWEIGRIALVDRLLLRMAIVEMMTFEDIPPKVSINEVIEIAKRYSTPKSGIFINGILDSILIQLLQEGRIRKTGRGLVGMPRLDTR